MQAYPINKAFENHCISKIRKNNLYFEKWENVL